MSKRKKVKKSPKSEDKTLSSKAVEQHDEDLKPNDYGGLPTRDLKKNLGCG